MEEKRREPLVISLERIFKCRHRFKQQTALLHNDLMILKCFLPLAVGVGSLTFRSEDDKVSWLFCSVTPPAPFHRVSSFCLPTPKYVVPIASVLVDLWLMSF